jgi:cyanophycin synthetase
MGLAVQIRDPRFYAGPNPFAPRPVVFVTAESHSNATLPDAQQLLERTATLSPRLDWAPQVALEATPFITLTSAMAALASYLLNMERGLIDSAGCRVVSPTEATVFVGYHNVSVSTESLNLALWLLTKANEELSDGDLKEIDQRVEAFALNSLRHHPDYISRIIMLGARARKVPIVPLNVSSAWQYGWGANSSLFFEAGSNGDGLVGFKISRSKVETAAFLRTLGLPVSEHRLAQTAEEAIALAREVGPVVVIKPDDRGKGKGVTVGVSEPHDIAQAFEAARPYSQGPILVERYIPGHDHRLLVIDGALVAASRRDPATIVGDGVSTVRQLIDRLNAERRADPITRRYLMRITLDQVVMTHLESQGLDPDGVPAEGRRVSLRSNANISTGGTPTNVVHAIHPDIRAMCAAVAAATGLRSIGIDYMTTDISRSWHETGGAIIEINSFPGLDVHVAAFEDEAKLGAALLGPIPGRIPTIVIIADQAVLSNATAPLRRSIDASGRQGFGVTLPMDSFLDRMGLDLPDVLPHRVNAMLRHRQCHALIIGCAPSELARHGFPLDHCDLAIVAGPVPAEHQDLVEHLTKGHASRTITAATLDAAAADRIIQAIPTAMLARQPAPPASPARTAVLPDGVTYVKHRTIGAGPTVFALMRNEKLLLPHFLDHYRCLGIENFILYDDSSDDGTREYAADQSDCAVLASNRAFNESLPGGRRFHHLLREAVPESLGADRWALVVDMDEFLILPDGFTRIADFLAMLDRRGHECVFGTMVDAYPERLSQRNYSPSLSPFEGSPYFDIDRGFRRQLGLRKTERELTSVRGRLIRHLKRHDPEAYQTIFAGKSYLMPNLSKVPFIKTGRGIERWNSHTVNRQPPFDVEVALAHFKFGPDLDGRIARALAERTYLLGSIEYQFLQAVLERFADLDLRCDRTRRFDDPGALGAAGLTRYVC